MSGAKPRIESDRSRTTLKEVAREVGVSVCTVSVVLNNSSSGSRISARTRTAVLEAADRLGYRPNRLARSLQTGHTHMIGVVPAAADENIMLGPHLQNVLNGIVNETEAHGYDVSLITRCDQSRVADLLDALLDGRVDGVVVVAPRLGSRLVQMLKQEGLPTVVIDGDPEECDGNFIIDNDASVSLAVKHLHDLGHRDIGHIAGAQELYAARVRTEAFFRATKRYGMNVDLEWIQVGTFSYNMGSRAMKRMLKASTLPTAVFCANDDSAFGAMEAIAEAGLSVPGDISVVGFDDVPLANHSKPPLTTLQQPVENIARASASALISYIENRTPIAGRSFKGALIERASTGVVPGAKLPVSDQSKKNSLVNKRLTS